MQSNGLIAAVGGSDWTYGGSILTFAFPMLLFIAVAGALYVLYTKPHLVPGHRYHLDGRSVAATPSVSMPGHSGQAGGQRAAARGEGATAASDGKPAAAGGADE
ncbi:MAG TPA: hypothetical protein VIV12_23430 [Streptosporangiaceae bacterium]